MHCGVSDLGSCRKQILIYTAFCLFFINNLPEKCSGLNALLMAIVTFSGDNLQSSSTSRLPPLSGSWSAALKLG